MLVKHSENLKIAFKLKKEETKRDWYERNLFYYYKTYLKICKNVRK